MDFLEDLELYNSAMENAYQVITGRVSVEEVYMELEDTDEDIEFPLPFNPFLQEDITDSEIDDVIEYFIDIEEYEKCQELVNCKKMPHVTEHR